MKERVGVLLRNKTRERNHGSARRERDREREIKGTEERREEKRRERIQEY